MRKMRVCFLLILASWPALAQRPDRDLLPLTAYTLEGYEAEQVSEVLTLPDGVSITRPSGIVFDDSENMLILHRGEDPLMEFDEEGNFIRAFGPRDTWTFSHGLRLDAEGNIWVSDIGTHTVVKMDRSGNHLMTLGTPGRNGLWDESSGEHLFDQPNDMAFDSHGNVYIAQGHGRGEPRVLKFDSQGNFISQWGRRGDKPGEFAVAHAIEIDAQDRIYVADRENFRIQIFDTDGRFLDQWIYSAMACAIYLHDDGTMYMTSGFDGEWGILDSDGKVTGSLGRPGEGLGRFGEGHFMTVDRDGNVLIADPVASKMHFYRKTQ